MRSAGCAAGCLGGAALGAAFAAASSRRARAPSGFALSTSAALRLSRRLLQPLDGACWGALSAR
eukprot:1636068-Pyramimonas_sp.AAC.1